MMALILLELETLLYCNLNSSAYYFKSIQIILFSFLKLLNDRPLVVRLFKNFDIQWYFFRNIHRNRNLTLFTIQL